MCTRARTEAFTRSSGGAALAALLRSEAEPFLESHRASSGAPPAAQSGVGAPPSSALRAISADTQSPSTSTLHSPLPRPTTTPTRAAPRLALPHL